jgi:hypothetical protein
VSKRNTVATRVGQAPVTNGSGKLHREFAVSVFDSGPRRIRATRPVAHDSHENDDGQGDDQRQCNVHMQDEDRSDKRSDEHGGDRDQPPARLGPRSNPSRERLHPGVPDQSFVEL